MTLGASDNPVYFRKGSSLNVRVLPSNLDGKVLIYDFVPELTGNEEQQKSLFAQYNSSDNAAVNAKLKVWYLDIPAMR